MQRGASFVVTAVLALAVPAGALAQEPAAGPEGSWEWKGVADLGIRVASRNLGTNTGTSVFLTPFAVRSTIDPVPVLGVGVQVDHRYRTIGVRAMVRTTLGATMTGSPGICSLIEGEVCREHEGGATVTSFAVEALASTRREAPVRVSFSLGAGLRRYEFEGLGCRSDEHLCLMVDDIKTDQIQPMLTFGVGLNGAIGGVRTHLKLQDAVGPFHAAGPNAEGEIQSDVLITFGVAIPFN